MILVKAEFITMGELANFIINNIISNFDFRYIISINVLTYVIIKLIDEFNGNKKVKTWTKRLILIISIIVITVIYKLIGYDNNINLVNSAILAPVFWSWVGKPICKKFNIDYKQINDIMI